MTLKLFTVLCILFFSSTEALSQQQTTSFTENKGQISDQYYKSRPDVLFSGYNKSLAYFLRNTGISYQLEHIERWGRSTFHVGDLKNQLAPAQSAIYRIDINWLNINKNFKIAHKGVLPGYSNYYLQTCGNGATRVQSYSTITYENIYNNIDIQYYQKAGLLKYDYLVSAGADYKQIQLEVNGAEEIVVQKDGSLLLKTPLGNLQEDAPIVFENGKQLEARWICDKNILSFEIQDHDPSKALIIDPIIRAWGTYFGGSQEDGASHCTTDNSGNAFITGSTISSNNIITSGAHKTIKDAFDYDAFLTKFDANGSRIWSTYYGGNGGEKGNSCSVGNGGEIYMAGITGSETSTVIATNNSHQTNYADTDPMFGADIFLAKFDANGLRLWGTYYGGENKELDASCSTDKFGNIFLSGRTGSQTGTVIATPGSYQPIYQGTSTLTDMEGNAFLAKFNSNGVRLWGTYYSGGDETGTTCCVADLNGNCYLTGSTFSDSTFMATQGAHQAFSGGGYDAFLVKFSPSGLRLWGTFYGGSAYEYAFSCSVQDTSFVYLNGKSGSIDVNAIATPGSHQSIFGGGDYDAFLVKFDKNGNRQWGTYYGTSDSEVSSSCSVDPQNNVYLVGVSADQVVPSLFTTTDAFQPNNNGGEYDAFISKFDAQGVRQWATFYGGPGNDYPFSCNATYGPIYIAGATSSSTGTALISSGCHQYQFGGGTSDVFFTKFTTCSEQNGSLIFCTDIPETEIGDERISVYPNPSNRNLSIETSQNSAVHIVDLLGREILSSHSMTKHHLDISHFAPGIYIVQILINNAIKSVKILKE